MGKRNRLTQAKIEEVLTLGENKWKLRAFIVFSVLVILSLLAFFAYNPPSFLSENSVNKINAVVGNLPLVPKTPKQVLTAAVSNTQKLNSYSVDVSASVGVLGNNKLVNVQAHGDIVDARNDESKSQGRITGQVGIPFFASNLNLQTVEVGNDLYFYLGRDLNFAGFNLSSVAESWQKVDLSNFQASLGVKAPSKEQILLDVEDRFREVFIEAVNSSSNNFSDLEKVSEDGEDFYRIVVTPKVETVEATLGVGEDLDPQNIKLTLYVSKKDKFLKRVTFQIDLLAKEIFSVGLSNITIDYKISNINEDIEITIPKNFSQINDPLKLTTKLGWGDSNNILQQTLKARSLGGDFLTLERLLKVLYLLPLTIGP